jgi:hypothetical protein
MRKFAPGIFVFFVLLSLSVLQSCVDDRDEFLARQNFVPDQSFTEEFDTALAAYTRGWRFLNRSVDIGPSNWSNPAAPPPFGPYSSRSTSSGYLWADYNSTSSGTGIISNWAVSPPMIMKDGDKIIFYTRTQLYAFGADSTDFANRLQVRINPLNQELNVGLGADAGDFTIIAYDINPNYKEFSYNAFIANNADVRNAYPHRWTRFEITLSGLNKPTKGRFAFRYFVEDAGNNGRGSSVGIDQVNYISAK